jgi:N-acetylneuraminate lyase
MTTKRTWTFDRIICALVTPMRSDETVNHDIVPAVVDAQLARGVEGFYCCGSSGEGPLLRLDERADFVARVVEAVGRRVPVIAHVGTPRTRDAVELARRAEADGADAVSLVPPYYYRFNRREIVDYYRRVLGAVSIPIVIYNIPQFTGVELDGEMARSLLREPQVLGVKHTSNNLYSLERMAAEYPDKIFFNGFDEIFLSSLAAGATATIGTTVNVQPELFLAVRRAFKAGDFSRARSLQQQINDVVEAMIARGIFQSAKYMAGHGIGDLGPAREPFEALTADQKAELDLLIGKIKTAVSHAGFD